MFPRAEAERVFHWRREIFIKDGFAEHVADFLASTRIDLTEMKKLLDGGCSLDTAIKILIGTMFSGDDEDWPVGDDSFVADFDLDHAETPFNRLVYPILGSAGEASEAAT